MSRETVPWLAAAVLFAGVLVVLRLMVGGGVYAQQVGWPTPPPGEQFTIPTEDQVRAPITASVERPGSEVQIVRPAWPGPIPLIPPIPSTRVVFEGGAGGGPPLTVRVDAGTFAEVVQLRMSPADAGELPTGVYNVLWAFELEAFDAAGRPVRGALQRPLKLTIPAGAFTAAGIDGRDLLIAMVDDEHFTPVVTAFGTSDQLLTVRLLKLGTVALIDDSG